MKDVKAFKKATEQYVREALAISNSSKPTNAVVKKTVRKVLDAFPTLSREPSSRGPDHRPS